MLLGGIELGTRCVEDAVAFIMTNNHIAIKQPFIRGNAAPPWCCAR